VWEQLKSQVVSVKVGEGETGKVKLKVIGVKDLEGS